MAKLPLYFLLAILLTTTAASTSDAKAEGPLEAPLEELSSVDDLLCPFRFNFTSCWVSIAKVDGCAVELVKSITSFKVNVSTDCCNAVSDVSEKCFSIFGGLFAPLLRSHCIVFFPNAPLAEGPGSSA